MMEQEAALKGVASSKLRCLLAYNKFLDRADVAIGDSVLLHKTVNRRGAGHKTANRRGSGRRRGPAEIPDIDETGVTVKFRSRTFQVARFCVRKKMKGKNAS